MMKKAADILKEMGFKKDSPLSAQEAFLKYLTKSTPLKEKTASTNTLQPEQLSFDLPKIAPAEVKKGA